jgi:hypothetical protein
MINKIWELYKANISYDNISKLTEYRTNRIRRLILNLKLGLLPLPAAVTNEPDFNKNSECINKYKIYKFLHSLINKYPSISLPKLYHEVNNKFKLR